MAKEEVLFLLLGVFGILLFLKAIHGVAFAEWAVILIAVLFCTFLWFFWLFQRQRRIIFWTGLSVVAVLCIGAAIRHNDILKAQARHVWQCLRAAAESETMDITGLAIFFIVCNGICLKLAPAPVYDRRGIAFPVTLCKSACFQRSISAFATVSGSFPGHLFL